MERQAPFVGPNIDPHALAQMHQMTMQRMQQNGQGGNPEQSPYGGQMADPKADSDKQTNKEPRPQAHEQDMEIGYEDKPSTPSFEGLEQRFLDEIMQLAKEQCDAEDAENARHRERIIEINAQYQEKLSSLRAQQAKRREEFLLKEAQARLHQYKQAASNHYPANASPIDPRSYGPKNVSPIDSRGYGPTNASSIDPRGPLDPRGYGPTTASRIDPHGYGPTNGGPIDPRVPVDPRGYGPTNTGPIDPRVYGGAAAAEAHQAYAAGQFESSRERRPFAGGGRNQVPEARVPIPEGRVYNNTSARNH
ncbi:hypothetical protein RHSIM_Rhsim03G0094100 [Rhododendron simsii]|uniref:Uncharacterized protein n=1 Tax=Rhododendron simsii TaxID=118357 RepID=A0A834H3S4_RHOSS|nr:hypothetical protein RHSIM_Rhsim03G0094100 [Rhododendron simsii]